MDRDKIVNIIIVVVCVSLVSLIIWVAVNCFKIYLGSKVYESASNAVENAIPQINEQAIEVFNMNIEPYLGEGKSGSQTKSAIEQILDVTDEDRKVTITLDGEKIEDSLKIFVSRKYSITSEKDSDGYINKVVIETE